MSEENTDAPASEAIDLLKYRIDSLAERGVNIAGRSFTVTGEVSIEMFQRVDAWLTFFETDNAEESITIKLCSEGGHIYPALAIIGRIKASPCHIKIEAYGQIMSAATAIFAVADERVASEYTMFMFHMASVTLPDNLKTRDVRIELKQVEREDLIFSDIIGKHTTTKASVWQKMIQSGRNVYLSSEECMKLGLIDSII